MTIRNKKVTQAFDMLYMRGLCDAVSIFTDYEMSFEYLPSSQQYTYELNFPSKKEVCK